MKSRTFYKMKVSPALGALVITSALLGMAPSAVHADEIPFDTNVPDSTGGSFSQAPENLQAAPPPAPADKQSVTDATAQAQSELDNPVVQPPPPTLIQPLTNKPKTARAAPPELSGLGKLAPFSDIAVITKRFLPKTHRFEFFPNLGLIMNDAFFTDFVLGGRLGFYFSENWGLELSAESISSSPKGVTSELQTIRGVQTSALATPSSFYGADVKWDPIYGKLGLMDKTIVPFDFFFMGGVGTTGTNQGTNPLTIHLGVGQLFAINKWMGARWDISYYTYNSTTTVGPNAGSQQFNNIHATIGMSFFFPQAEYR